MTQIKMSLIVLLVLSSSVSPIATAVPARDIAGKRSVDWWLGSYTPSYIAENADFIQGHPTTITGDLEDTTFPPTTFKSPHPCVLLVTWLDLDNQSLLRPYPSVLQV